MDSAIVIIGNSGPTKYLIKKIIKGGNLTPIFFNLYSNAQNFLLKNKCRLILINIDKVLNADIEFIKTINEFTTLNQIPIIIISTDNSFEQISKCLESGATDFISKPACIDSIQNKINLALNETKILNYENKLL